MPVIVVAPVAPPTSEETCLQVRDYGNTVQPTTAAPSMPDVIAAVAPPPIEEICRRVSRIPERFCNK